MCLFIAGPTHVIQGQDRQLGEHWGFLDLEKVKKGPTFIDLGE